MEIVNEELVITEIGDLYLNSCVKLYDWQIKKSGIISIAKQSVERRYP